MKLKGCRRDQERSSLWELVKTFVHRGMEGVVCELADETGPMGSGMHHIDERLSSELVEDNVRTTGKSSVWNTMSGPERCRQSRVSPGRRQVMRSVLR